MKSKLVDSVTSDEEHVRLRIFDGEIPMEDAVWRRHTRKSIASASCSEFDLIFN